MLVSSDFFSVIENIKLIVSCDQHLFVSHVLTI